MKKNLVSLDRAISKLGLASRSKALGLIKDGKIKVNGKLISDPHYKVHPESAKIEIDGEIQTPPHKLTIVFHKPKGLVTTSSDEKGRDTIYKCLAEIKIHLPAVGRLDLATSGLLILTNDNRLSNWLTDPMNEIPREYIATVRGEVTDDQKDEMIAGVIDQDQKLCAKDIEIIKSSGKESLLKVTLIEGKNREIRRLMLHFNHEVTALKRVSFGGLKLGDLESSKWKELSKDELREAFPQYPYFNS